LGENRNAENNIKEILLYASKEAKSSNKHSENEVYVHVSSPECWEIPLKRLLSFENEAKVKYSRTIVTIKIAFTNKLGAH
jgi:hypothetical protein